MNLDDLKDRYTEVVSQLKESLEESSLYNTLRERFEVLSSTAQKSIIIGSSALLVLILLSIPLSFLSTSGDYTSEFDENRQLIRELLRTRSAGSGPPLPRGLNSSELESRVNGLIKQGSLLDNQIAGLEVLPSSDPSLQLAPKTITQFGLKIMLNQLNLKQVIDFGYQFQTLDPSVKLIGMEMKASKKDNHYYDTTFKIVSFTFPDMEEKLDDKKGFSNRKRGK